eukprot:TRINITY_DN20803_c0_g1_i1.p1 TRINITY_DN20803_c0_g1~~TRINITY_DN20803_c0_g1_i1.p1  ORF type:complete len:276 (+),score=58.86 TRINITY_DN20803_c0_g1_i1:59-886(+)
MPGSINLYPTNAAPVPYTPLSINYKLDNGVAVCMWDIHKTRNALTTNMVLETMATIEHLKRDEKVKVAVWGGKTNFGSGLDLKGDKSINIPKDIVADYTNRGIFPPNDGTDNILKGLTLAFWDFPKISVAAIEGFAVGGACNMALAGHHDFIIASDTARFIYPFMKLGITPELGSSYILPSFVGLPRAKELLLLGEWFSSKEAHKMGLVTRLSADPWKDSVALAAQLAANPKQHTLRAAKKLLNSHHRAQMDNSFPKEMAAMSEMVAQKWAFAKL